MFFQGYASYAIGSVCEWATTVAIMVYILTFVPEFRHVHLAATLSSDPRPAATPGEFEKGVDLLNHIKKKFDF